MDKIISGRCCCGEVTFELEDNFSKFFFCHCEQCRKLTGTAYASNLFTSPENIRWLKGTEYVTRYEHPSKPCFKVFCKKCGSALPMLHKNGEFLVIPAGSLDQEPQKRVDAQIYIEEQTKWCEQGVSAKKVKRFNVD